MHLLIPHASALSPASADTLRDLRLPNLHRLLNSLQASTRDMDDEYTLSMPHERAWAAANAWKGSDGCWPWAALQAADDGVEVGRSAWGLVTPTHWHVGREHISLADPQALDLPEDESRALFDAVRPLFEESVDAAPRLVWGEAWRWYLDDERLAEMPCASIDRAIGRNVDLWLRADPTASAGTLARLGWIRRLQNEVQMLLHDHPINAVREARGALPVNSFWLSGCGRAQRATAPVVVDDRLRAPLLAGDWVGWAAAWQALDADALKTLADHADDEADVSLTLCGERGWQRFDAVPRSRWQLLADRLRGRLGKADAPAVLAAL